MFTVWLTDQVLIGERLLCSAILGVVVPDFPSPALSELVANRQGRDPRAS